MKGNQAKNVSLFCTSLQIILHKFIYRVNFLTAKLFSNSLESLQLNLIDKFTKITNENQVTLVDCKHFCILYQVANNFCINIRIEFSTNFAFTRKFVTQ